MPRPEKPTLTGTYRSADNRFEWNANTNPSPMRCTNSALARQTEHLPVLCDWCGRPYWPPANVAKGICSSFCTTQQQQYLQERTAREKLLDELLEKEVENDALRGLLGRVNVDSPGRD